jgi:hypothetical protein
VEEDEAFFVGGINAKEDACLLIADAGRHLCFRAGIFGWKELKDLLHLLIVFELVAFRDRYEAGNPILVPIGKVWVEVVGSALEVHGDESCFGRWYVIESDFFQKCFALTCLVKEKL